MYLTKNHFNLTKNETLWDKVSWSRLNEFLTDPEVGIVEFERSSNSYGEFRFITIRKGNHGLSFYGHGYHEYREQYFASKWSIYIAQFFEDKKALCKSDVLNELSREHVEYLHLERNNEPQSHEAHLYSEIADLTDEDGALSELGYI